MVDCAANRKSRPPQLAASFNHRNKSPRPLKTPSVTSKPWIVGPAPITPESDWGWIRNWWTISPISERANLAAENRVLSERLAADPEVKKRYQAAREKRRGSKGSVVKLIPSGKRWC